MTQICNVCHIEKPLSSFEHQKKRPSPRKTCKVCRYEQRDKEKEQIRHREYMKERRLHEPEVLRQNWERHTYGVCKEDFNYAHCVICGKTDKLCIDHCHTSKEVRGLLCSSCNFGLGNFKDNPVLLANAIKYLVDGPHIELDRKRYP